MKNVFLKGVNVPHPIPVAVPQYVKVRNPLKVSAKKLKNIYF